MTAPRTRAATAPMMIEATTAAVPPVKNQGSRGSRAPTPKARKDATAAFPAEPEASGSMPSSRRAWVSRATPGVDGEDAGHGVGVLGRHAPGPVHGGQLPPLGLGRLGQLLLLHPELPLHQLVLGPHRHQLAGGHGKGPGQQAGDPDQADGRGVGGARRRPPGSATRW